MLLYGGRARCHARFLDLLITFCFYTVRVTVLYSISLCWQSTIIRPKLCSKLLLLLMTNTSQQVSTTTTTAVVWAQLLTQQQQPGNWLEPRVNLTQLCAFPSGLNRAPHKLQYTWQEICKFNNYLFKKSLVFIFRTKKVKQVREKYRVQWHPEV